MTGWCVEVVLETVTCAHAKCETDRKMTYYILLVLWQSWLSHGNFWKPGSVFALQVSAKRLHSETRPNAQEGKRGLSVPENQNRSTPLTQPHINKTQPQILLYLAHFPTESHSVIEFSGPGEQKNPSNYHKAFGLIFLNQHFFFLGYTTLSSSNYEMQARVMVAKLPLVGLPPPKNQ